MQSVWPRIMTSRKVPVNVTMRTGSISRRFSTVVMAVATAGIILGISGPAQADEGADLFDRGLYSEAIAAWQHASETLGDPTAEFRLGDIYEAGAVVEEDLTEAAKWYTRAAKGGHPAAQFALAAFYEAGAGVPQSAEKAAHWYRECANRGQPNCQFALGLLLGAENSPLPDPVEAYKWYYLAAKNGLIEFDAPELMALARRMDQQQKRDALSRAVAFEVIE